MKQQKILFIDRDGTLIAEPADQQIDSLEKFSLLPDVIPALLKLKEAGFLFVMVSNQDGLGTCRYPQETFEKVQAFLVHLFASQGIHFEAVHICSHFSDENCECRKPKIALIKDYFLQQTVDLQHSYVIGDRETDLELAKNLNIAGVKIGDSRSWSDISRLILEKPKSFTRVRKTQETTIEVTVNLSSPTAPIIHTGIHFFDHMLEQLGKHGQFGLEVNAQGDLQIDDHHTVEDVGITLGQTLSNALGDKRGIQRYGFLLPMDESLTTIALDLGGRSFFSFKGQFSRERVGDLSTELVPHFFRSFSTALEAALHIQVEGENTHHMIESIFKGVGRTLQQAISQNGQDIPSTKGVL